VYVGATYLVPSGPNDKMHLHVVLVPPDEAGETIWVSICSIKEGLYSDNSCEFLGGEHEFITHQSYAAYNFLSFINIKHIRKMIDLNFYRQKDDASPELLANIFAG